MKKMDRDTGGKRRGRERGRKIIRLAAVVWLLCALSDVNTTRGEPGVAGLTAFTALANARGSNVNTSTETGETPVNITDENQLKQWCDQRLTGGNSIGILPKNMIITKPITLGLPDSRTNIDPVEIRIPEGPIKILAPKSLVQADVVIDNPNLFITGTKSMISVEGEEYLTLKRGQIQGDTSDEPAIVLRSQGAPVWEEGKDFKGLKKTDIRDERINPPEPVPPDESQTEPEYGDTQSQLTEAVLLNIGTSGSSSAKLEFRSLPSDINALYILRSEKGHSWEKGKNKVTATSSQSGQETVGYKSLLREAGNMLNASIVTDDYLIYRFQSGGSSFYMETGTEWPGGSYETDKVGIVTPGTVGQDLIFLYGGGSYSYRGGYADGYDSGFGRYGRDSTSGGDFSTQSGTQEGSDVPEGPMRGRRDRRRDPYTLYSVPGYKDGGTAAGRIIEEMIQEATPSKARGLGEKDGDSDSQIRSAAGWKDTNTAGQTEEGNEIMDTEPDPSQGEGKNSGISGLEWYTDAMTLGRGVVYFRRRGRK